MVADVVVVGAGVIGLAIALEMQERGARVIVMERGEAMQQASTAAAGMLAVDDPANPIELLALARLSVALYPEFLRKLEGVSGVAVPFQTQTTIQHDDGAVRRLAEWSIDPRQLAVGMLRAVRCGSIVMLERMVVESVEDIGSELRVRAAGGLEMVAKAVVYATGAWAAEAAVPVKPRKGQMLRVQLAGLTEVHRSERVYVVPRTNGAQAGTALIGATVEDVGFDTVVHAEAVERLRWLAAELVPEVAEAPMVEAWAGLRPGTPDGLPMLGAGEGVGRFIASGHYRNGVMLAPGTAVVMADLLMGVTPVVDVSAFSPRRFSR